MYGDGFSTRSERRNLLPRRRALNLLAAVGQDQGPQHGMAFDQAVPGLLQPLDANLAAFQFDVIVHRHVAGVEVAVAAQPVGLLHIVEGKGLEQAGRIAANPWLVGRSRIGFGTCSYSGQAVGQ